MKREKPISPEDDPKGFTNIQLLKKLLRSIEFQGKYNLHFKRSVSCGKQSSQRNFVENNELFFFEGGIRQYTNLPTCQFNNHAPKAHHATKKTATRSGRFFHLQSKGLVLHFGFFVVEVA